MYDRALGYMYMCVEASWCTSACIFAHVHRGMHVCMFILACIHTLVFQWSCMYVGTTKLDKSPTKMNEDKHVCTLAYICMHTSTCIYANKNAHSRG
jgi:hypothetical protein